MFKNSKIQYLLVFAFCFISFLPAALLVDVFQVSEAREGVVVQQILATDNWVLPLRHGAIVPSKPPLFHWIGAGFAKLFGEYNLLLLRLPSILAASFLLVAYFIIAKYFLSDLYGLLSTIALLTTYGFFHLAVDGRVDMLFTAFVFAAVCIWLLTAINIVDERRSYRDFPERIYFLIAVLCGFAVLTKGPLGLVLPSMTIFFMAFGLWGVYGALSTIRPSWIFAILIPALWYYLAWQQGGDSFVQRHLFFENLQRFSGGKGVNQEPWWFYLTHIWGQAAPWFLLILVPAFFKNFYHELKNKSSIVLSLTIWIFSALLLFTLSSGKRRAYLLPILPALILLFSIVAKDILQSHSFQKRSERIIEWLKTSHRSVALSLLPFFAVLLSFALASCLASVEMKPRAKLALDAFFQIFSNNCIVICALLLVLAAFSMSFFMRAVSRKKIEYFFLAILIINLQLVAIVMPFLSSIKSITHSMHNLKKLALEAVPEGETLTAIKYDKDESLDVFFYLYGRTTAILRPDDLSKLNPGYFIAPIKYLPRISLAASNSGKLIQQIVSGKRPSDMDNESFAILKILEEIDSQGR